MDKISDSKIYRFFCHVAAVLKDAGRSFGVNGGTAAAGNMAFLAMFCMFPFLIFLVSLSGFIGQTNQGLEAIAFILSLMPAEVSSVLEKPIMGILKNTGTEILTISIAFSLFTAAGGIEAGREICIRAFGREHGHAFWKRRLESLLFVVVAAVLVILAMSVQVMGPAIMQAMTSLFPDVMSEKINSLWALLSFLISPLILLIGLWILYLALTPRSVYRPYRFPGALFTLILFMITAKGMSTYLKSVGTYDVTYGSLAGVVIAQLFCFIVSLGFIFGAEFNAAWTRYADRMTRSDDSPDQSKAGDA